MDLHRYGRTLLALSRAGGAQATSAKLVAPTTKGSFPRRLLSTTYNRRKGFFEWCKGAVALKPVAAPAECPDYPPALVIPGFPEQLPPPPPEAVVPPLPCASPKTPVHHEPRVVVIGAGASGLSAAAYLIDSGITDVIVLEGRCRPGGRVFSTVLGDAIIELGADLGCPPCSNLLHHMAAAEGFIDAAPTWDPARSLFTQADGRVVDSPISMMAYYRYRQAEEQLAERFAHLPERGIHGDFAEVMGQILRMEVQRFPVEHRNTAARIMTGLAAARRRLSSQDSRFIEKDFQGATLQLPGGPAIPLGLRGIFSGALKRIGPDRIRYNKVVTSIRWGTLPSGDPQVTVCCEDNEDPLIADYVIVTLPLGLLKEEHTNLFCPNLPADKIDVLDCLDLVHVTKIYLAYEHSFWLWRDSPIVIRFPEEFSSEKPHWSWLAGINRLSELPGSNHVLLAVVLGEHAVAVEGLTDLEVMEVLTQALRKSTGDRCIPYPNDIAVSRWRSDRFSGGTGTALPAFGNTLCAALADPVPGPASIVTPALFFAGEHTGPKCGTVQGAALSGIREAEKVLEVVAQRYAESSCNIRCVVG